MAEGMVNVKPLSERRRRSARETFSNCQYAYAGEYVWGVGSENDYTRRGSLFHRARELYISLLWAARESSDHLLAEAAWHQAAFEMPIPYAMHQDARDIWRNWTETFELNLTTFWAVETDIVSHFGARLKLDEVHVTDADTIRVIDAKTLWQIPSVEELEADFQTACYLAAVRKLFPGFRRREMVYDFARYGKQVTVSLSESALDEIDAYLETQTAAMARADDEGVYPATPGSHCGRCVMACPVIDATERRVERVVSPSEAVEAAGYLVALEQEQSSLRTALRAYAVDRGPVSVDDVTFGFWPTEKRVYPLVQVATVLEEEGLAALGLTVSASTVKRVTESKKKYAAAGERIKALATVTLETEFGAKRVAQVQPHGADTGQGRAEAHVAEDTRATGTDGAADMGPHPSGGLLS